MVSKLSSLTDDQRDAAIAFLEAVRERGDDYVAEQADNGAPLLAGARLGGAGVLVERGPQTAGGLGCRALERPYVALEERDRA